jgi:hypothetical protein
MKPRAGLRDWLPLAPARQTTPPPAAGEAFRPEWFDLERGIRVGNLEPHERITQILKSHLEATYRTPFVIDRWGRGVYWQWICWLPRANRAAKPISSAVNFGCAKLYLSLDREGRALRAGLQVERGYAQGPAPYPGCLLQPDWDWHRLVAACETGSSFDRELHRLIDGEGFVAEVGDWTANAVFAAGSFTSAAQIRAVLQDYPRRQWVGFQLYYSVPETELRRSSGAELVQAIRAVFDDVVPAMNACLQVPLETARGAGAAVEDGPAGTFRRRRSSAPRG